MILFQSQFLHKTIYWGNDDMFHFSELLSTIPIFTYQKNPSIELSPYLWGRTKKNSRTIQVRNLVDWLFMICLQYSKIKNVLILTIWSTIKLKRNLKKRYTVCITLQKLRRFCLMKWSSEILSNLPYIFEIFHSLLQHNNWKVSQSWTRLFEIHNNSSALQSQFHIKV